MMGANGEGQKWALQSHEKLLRGNKHIILITAMISQASVQNISNLCYVKPPKFNNAVYSILYSVKLFTNNYMHFLFLQKIIKDKPETNKKDFIGYRIHRNGVEGIEIDSKTSFGIISPMYFSFHTK